MRVPEVVLGLLLVTGCALVAVVWQQRTNVTTTVVVAARDITRGAVITAEDLRGAEVAGETDGMIAGDDAVVLLGQTALVDIAADAPMTPSLVAGAERLEAQEALISMALQPGQFPPDLAATDSVRIVLRVAGEPGEPDVTTLLDDVATVWSVVAAPDGVATVVTLRSPVELSAEVAGAAGVLVVRVAEPVAGGTPVSSTTVGTGG